MNISDTLGCASCASFLFLPHFDVICDLLLNRRTATWNLFVKCTPVPLTVPSYNVSVSVSYSKTQLKLAKLKCSYDNVNLIRLCQNCTESDRGGTFAKHMEINLQERSDTSNFRFDCHAELSFPLFCVRSFQMTIESKTPLRLLFYVTGFKISRQFFNQWEAKQKPISSGTCDFSSTLRKLGPGLTPYFTWTEFNSNNLHELSSCEVRRFTQLSSTGFIWIGWGVLHGHSTRE